MESSGAGNTTMAITDILEAIENPSTSLITKYKRENELKTLARTDAEALPVIKTLLSRKTGFVYKKLLLECELESFHVDYLVNLVMTTEEPTLAKYGVTKYNWMFQQDTVFNDSAVFINTMLPVMSYSLRNLILWKIGKNCPSHERCEALYLEIEKLCGPSVANILLTACGTTFVENMLQKNKSLVLRSRQVIWLLKKHPFAAISYFRDNAGKHPTMLKRVIRIDPVSFADIFEKSPDFFNISCSPAETKILINTCLLRITKNINSYSRILHSLTVFRRVEPITYMKFVEAELPSANDCFPDPDLFTESGIDNAVESWIVRLPSGSNKVEIFKESFERKYGSRLEECPSYITESVLSIFPPVDRDALCDLKLAFVAKEQDTSPDPVKNAEWIAYKPIEKSIPALKFLIGKESDFSKRQSMLEYLVQTCKINKDGAMLNEVCRYYVERHRNEREDTHRRFVRAISEFGIKELVLDATGIQNLVDVFKLYVITVNKGHSINISEDLLEAIYIAQLNLNLSTSWTQMILGRILLSQIRSWRPTWNFDRNRNFRESYLTFMENMVKNVDMSQEFKTTDELAMFIIAVLTFCRDWNRNRSTFKLSINRFPVIELKLQEILQNPDELSDTLLESLATALLHDSTLSSNPINDTFVQCFDLRLNETLIQHFFRYHISILTSKWELVSKYLFSEVSLTSCVGLLNHLKWHGYKWHLDRMKQQAEKSLSDDGIDQMEKVRAVVVASRTFTAHQFLDMASNYYCRKSGDAVNQDEKPESILDFMAVQGAICQNLRNVQDSRVFVALTEFCAGDTLQYVLGSMRSHVLNSELEAAKQFLTQLCQRPAVSVKKHGIRLMAQIAFNQGFCNFLMTLWKSNEHRSIRSVILTLLLHRLDFDTTAWDVLQEAVGSLSIADTEAMNSLLTYPLIPLQLVEDYGTMVWNKYMEDVSDEPMPYPGFILTWMNSYFDRLSASWMLKFLENQKIFAEGESKTKRIQSTARDYLATLLARSLLKFPKLQSQFLELLNTNLSFVNSLTYHGALNTPIRSVLRFVQELCRLSFDRHQTSEAGELAQLFEGVGGFSFFSSLDPRTFAASFFLKCSMLTLANNVKIVEGKGRVYGVLLDDAIKLHSARIFPYWAQQFQTFLQDMWHPWENSDSTEANWKLNLGLELLESKENIDEKMMLAVILLPKKRLLRKELGEKWETVMTKVSGSESFVVQLQLVHHLLEVQD